MIKLRIEGVDAVRRMLDPKQSRFAAAVALTRTAKAVDKRLGDELRSRLKSATPYTLKSTFSTSAKPAALQAIVGIKDKKPARGSSPAMILKEHFTGGMRGNKPMEKAMYALGILKNGWRVTVGEGIATDNYGNPKRQAVAEILGSLKSGVQIYKGRGTRAAMVGYFVITPGEKSHLHPGIYWRKDRALRCMFRFVSKANYSRLIHLDQLAGKEIQRTFNAEFATAFDQAVRTAR